MIARIFTVMIVIVAFTSEADQFELKRLRINEKDAVVAEIRLAPDGPRLELYWKKDDGAALQTFEGLRSWLARKNKKLLFAANAGIYRDSPSFAPIGLHVEHGNKLVRLSFAENCGNFCWYSGIFAIQNDQALILPREEASTIDFRKSRLALQSGPLFMRSGSLQGSWSRSSYNLNRSAICTTDQSSKVLLVLATGNTNFYEFFDVIKKAGCRDALFLDGGVSSFYEGKAGVRFGNPFESYAGMLAVTRD